MTIEQIPADETVVMTDLWHRAFNAAGCNPMCHCCCKKLLVGSQFKLATVKTRRRYQEKQEGGGYSVNSGIDMNCENLQITREVMLCETCTVEKMNKLTAENRKAYEKYKAAGGGCLRVNGKIIH